jgi:hypothetical protein
MSALPPKADIVERDRHVRFVPRADIGPFLCVVELPSLVKIGPPLERRRPASTLDEEDVGWRWCQALKAHQ